MSQTVLSFRSVSAAPRPGWRAVVARLRARLEEARSLRAAAELDDRGLRDVGLSRAQAQSMTDGPVWELVPFLHR